MSVFSKPKLIVGLIAIAISGSAWAANQELNLYNARHYQTDEALYAGFTKATGIKVNRIDGKEDEMYQRIMREGSASPADVFLTVDAARLQIAAESGLFRPLKSDILDKRIPAHFRASNNEWFGFSYRARVIAYDKNKVKAEQVADYMSVASPAFKGQLCVRSGNHVYNRTMLAAMINHVGEDKARIWTEGVVANLARPPKGGDTDQVRAVAAGECSIALTNHYYVARLMASNKPEDQAVMEKVAIAFPDQKTTGTHVNISGGGVLKSAPNPEAAVKFLEYLASDEAQAYFANGNNEWPTVSGVKLDNPQLSKMSGFKIDELNVTEVVNKIPMAQRIIDQAGWK